MSYFTEGMVCRWIQAFAQCSLPRGGHARGYGAVDINQTGVRSYRFVLSDHARTHTRTCNPIKVAMTTIPKMAGAMMRRLVFLFAQSQYA